MYEKLKIYIFSFLGNTVDLFDLKPLFEHKVAPKRIGKFYDDYTMKISFCVPFQRKNDELTSPCWVEMSLNRMVEVPLAS